MKKTSVETAVGVFVMIGLMSVAYMTIKLGKMEWFGDGYYLLDARFDSVSGLKTGAQVDMAGVEIGQVADIRLDNERKVAVVQLKIREDVMLTDDVIASVKTSGLIGDKYIKLTPGGSDRILNPGGMIIDTESALDIEELVSKYVFGDAEK
ncbi:outer membrane lipid asymmetry maintenance protein MlaD [Desulfosarcina widdelii]|uniref:Outer membrane lipid asymmetry maintenance protein MlaD n=1 Tax=Desulfosarcina widdelii TaxID=947919 RepID=A0A5K7Z559_9BACT|nr:outer membrane lipid asymmetry maintenance protein MlaD [Desulfosarcina widdelii]BBO76906.1 outer membrane lipid asymmetry maintenance protein MlaD [Desulfosarcina widdelii]